MDDKQKKRDERNKDLVDRMRAGEKLSSFSPQASWFPPRPAIKKDKSLMAKLYKEEGDEGDQETLIVFPTKIDQ